MTPQTVVLNLGMPRSGTTLVQKMLEAGTGYFHQKVCEYHPWHPMNGTELYRLVNTFRRKNVVVVRTTRGLADVVASMRVGREMGNRHDWTDDQVAQLYRTEAANWDAFALVPDAVEHSIKCRVVSFDYDQLAHPQDREYVLRSIAELLPATTPNLVRYRNFMIEHWGKVPVNVGRLMRAQELDAAS